MNVVKLVRRSPVVFTLACGVVAAMIFVSEASYWRSIATLDALGAVGAARTSIFSLTQSVLDAESGQRGYLLTDRKEYLQPYFKAVKQVQESLKDLDDYYQTPAQKQALRNLQKLTETKLSEISETLLLNDQGKIEAATELVLSDIGKEKMEAIRALGAEMLSQENAKVVEGRGDLYTTLLLGRIGLAALGAISLLALFLYLRQVAAVERHEQEMRDHVLAERDRLELEVSVRTQQLTELTHHLQTAREDERHRLARNLHDDLGALLTSAKLDAARIRSRLAGAAPEVLERLAHLVDTLNSGIALGRRIIEDLRPSSLSNLGLVATLDILTREFAERSGIKVECALEPVQLKPAAELVVYRVVQEAITNLTKYAKATQVWVSLSARDGHAEVSVRDDGVGFDTGIKPISAYGLLGMRFRVEAEGGTLRLSSAPGRGTQIIVTLPESPPG